MSVFAVIPNLTSLSLSLPLLLMLSVFLQTLSLYVPPPLRWLLIYFHPTPYQHMLPLASIHPHLCLTRVRCTCIFHRVCQSRLA